MINESSADECDPSDEQLGHQGRANLIHRHTQQEAASLILQQNHTICSTSNNNSKSKKLFPQKLWDLINDGRFSFCLRWSDDGQLVYLNRDDFEESYLKADENQFHTQKAISFVRQMNMYGFRKVDDCYYENDNFKRDCEYLLKNMTRKRSNKTASSYLTSPTVPSTTAQQLNNSNGTNSLIQTSTNPQQTTTFPSASHQQAHLNQHRTGSNLLNGSYNNFNKGAAYALAADTMGTDIYGLLKKAQNYPNFGSTTNGQQSVKQLQDSTEDPIPLKLKRNSNEMLLNNNEEAPSRKRFNNGYKEASLLLQLANHTNIRNKNKNNNNNNITKAIADDDADDSDRFELDARTNLRQDQSTGNELNNDINNVDDFNQATPMLANNDLNSVLLNLYQQHINSNSNPYNNNNNNNNDNNNITSISSDLMHNNNINNIINNNNSTNVPSNANLSDGILRTLLTFFAVQTMLTHTKSVHLDTE